MTKLANIETVLPAEHADYFAALDSKHFGPNAIGSRFSPAWSLNSLLMQAVEQRGSLEGDDREWFIMMGAKPDVFLPNVRYIRVIAPGTLGIVPVTRLDPNDTITAVRTKPGCPVSLVTSRTRFGWDNASTDFGTIIIGPNSEDNASTAEMIWTAHPGFPIAPAREDAYPEGTVVTARQVAQDHPGAWIQLGSEA